MGPWTVRRRRRRPDGRHCRDHPDHRHDDHGYLQEGRPIDYIDEQLKATPRPGRLPPLMDRYGQDD
jgi:hypothetical protein